MKLKFKCVGIREGIIEKDGSNYYSAELKLIPDDTDNMALFIGTPNGTINFGVTNLKTCELGKNYIIQISPIE